MEELGHRVGVLAQVVRVEVAEGFELLTLRKIAQLGALFRAGAQVRASEIGSD